ncbi:hypothetical protein K435DRAFT_861827 [Dendrothele bispora CBS 962.96]|uniref:Retrovirus-related Pol polyprotein from transposon TNT 1-94-like beta-barrel domain-containing protein n=1 Tax=Dendrothele bispora (strain CBS 962.96) TaxID=1314807 RepID=A0A4S8LUW4_DENBC|nr:hypothetical protein K435DRAFT_861827 [Dendrothele bispora CBS 962.96]
MLVEDTETAGSAVELTSNDELHNLASQYEDISDGELSMALFKLENEDLRASVDWKEHVSVPQSVNESPKIALLTTDITPWYIDSGATIHLSPNRSDFYELKPIPPRAVKGVGGSIIQATGIGVIKIQQATGTRIRLENVRKPGN